MIQRACIERIIALSTQFPAVTVLGMRQVGKTTLARQAFPDATYVDLENPETRRRFLEDTSFSISEAGANTAGTIIFDEAQLVPPLFEALRGVIDADRKRNGRFILLGSAQPALIRSISETLAGRVGSVELEPLVTSEVRPDAPVSAMHRLWLHGGMPDALNGNFREWWATYIDTFVERDLARFGLQTDPFLLRRLLTLLAHQQGGLLNHSDLARIGDVSVHTIQRYLDLLEGTFLIRRLRPYFANVGKRLVKAPCCYLRDTGMLHHLLNLNSLEEVRSHPVAGASWKTFIVEEIQRRTHLEDPFASFFFWRTSDGHEADLLIERGGKADTLVEVKLGGGADAKAAAKLAAIAKQLGARRACIVSQQDGREMLNPVVERIGPEELFARRW